MEKILKTNNLLKPPKVGQIIEGKVVGRGKSALFLDLGPFGTGIIYGKEFYEAKEELKDLKDGDTISAKVLNLDNEEGYIELSVSSALKELAWEKLKQKKEGGEVLEVKILGANKGGLLAKISGIPAFIPVSQLKSEHYPRVEGGKSVKILKALQKFVGKKIKVKIIGLSQKEEKLILSERAREKEKIKEILAEYKVGQIVKGRVTGTTDFGVFLQFGEEGLEGLIHISELDWAIVENPSDVVGVGDEIEAKIIKITEDKVFLSLKALKEDPWKEIEKKYQKGDVIKGKVIQFNSFGAFVYIEEGVQGLVHISEFGTQKKMQEALKTGKEYNFKVLFIKPDEHKISLKLET